MDRLARALQAPSQPPVEEDPFAGLSPIEAMKLRSELEGRYTTDAEKAANGAKLSHEILSVIPGPGNAIAAQDAYGMGRDAVNAFGEGRIGAGALNTAGAALSGLGAVAGLPFGRLAKAIAQDAGRTTRMFAGPTAKTADHAALGKAQEMAGAGASRDDIWRDTGWFQGGDGKWRFEIDDSGADLSDIAARNFDAGKTTDGHLQEIVDHPALWSAYPGINPSARLDRGPEDGFFLSDTNGLYASAPDYDKAIGVNLHELQHGVQKAEGFTPGASQDYFYVKGPELSVEDKIAKQRLEKMRERMPEASSEVDQKLNDLFARAAYRDYLRTAGEVEARNVQKRMNMTPVERRATAPWRTQDTPDEQQLITW